MLEVPTGRGRDNKLERCRVLAASMKYQSSLLRANNN